MSFVSYVPAGTGSCRLPLEQPFQAVKAVFQPSSYTAFASREGRLRSMIVSSVVPSRSERAPRPVVEDLPLKERNPAKTHPTDTRMRAQFRTLRADTRESRLVPLPA
jgi:hypothetical protein